MDDNFFQGTEFPRSSWVLQHTSLILLGEILHLTAQMNLPDGKIFLYEKPTEAEYELEPGSTEGEGQHVHMFSENEKGADGPQPVLIRHSPSLSTHTCLH